MDSVSSKVTFEFSNLAQDVPVITEPFHAYLNIVADFSLIVNGSTVYSEELFPVVELAVESKRWLRTRLLKRQFVFTSLEAEDPLLWIRPAGPGWEVGSDISGQRIEGVDFTSIKTGINMFYEHLREQVLIKFNFDIETLFKWRAANL